MADFTSVGTQIKPPQGMSIADMVNLAGGVQSYQQAQELNPVALETARSQLSRLNQLTPLEVRGKAAETEVSEKTAPSRITESTEKATQSKLQTQTAEMDLSCLLYTSPSPRDRQKSRMPSSA